MSNEESMSNEEKVGIIGNVNERPALKAARKLDLEAMYNDATDDAPEYTTDDLAIVMARLQRKWNCSPSNVRRRILRNITEQDRVPRPRKPASKGRAERIAKKNAQRYAETHN